MAINYLLRRPLHSNAFGNEVFAKDGLLDDLKKALSERILNAELDEHLDGERVEGGANRRNGHSKKSLYIALGIRPDGTKEILGIWIEQTEGAKFWLRVMNELKNRGIGDILIAVVDGLKGFPEAINAVFLPTVIQTCIVHLIRHSLEFVSWKDRKLVVPALKAIYRAKNAETGLKALAEFETSFWGQTYPAIAQSWQRNWEHVVPFFAYPDSVRRIIYTTNAIEALNAKLRRAVRAREHFPNDDAAMKLLYLVLNNAADEWKRPPRGQDPIRRRLRQKVHLPMTKNGLAHEIPDSPSDTIGTAHLYQHWQLAACIGQLAVLYWMQIGPAHTRQQPPPQPPQPQPPAQRQPRQPP